MRMRIIEKDGFLIELVFFFVFFLNVNLFFFFFFNLILK